MGSLEKRLESLERRIEPPDENEAAKKLLSALYAATLDELGKLKAARARGCYRGPTPIQPRDPAGERLGYPYTTGQMTNLAIELVWEKKELPEELMADWKDSFQSLAISAGINPEKVEAYGPPGYAL